MASAWNKRPIPYVPILDIADSLQFQESAFGIFVSIAMHYWRKPFDATALSSEKLAFLGRTSPNRLRLVERAIRDAIPLICERLDRERHNAERESSGLYALLDKVNATRRANTAKARDRVEAAPVPAKAWGARRAASERRQANGVSGFVD